ncbi:MAG: DUF1819 family protein [Propionibacteriaceae bacterium]|nr:DUF1819 family protein [Propionibacteriaceae bacterium]
MGTQASSVPRYRLSFLVGGLLAGEAAIAAPLYLSLDDWKSTRAALDASNLLHARTQASAVRTSRELVQRMATLTDAEVTYLATASSSDRRHLMWVAFCRRYVLVAEFAVEVLRERFLLGTLVLETADFERFVSSKSLWHEELEVLKPSTLRKLRTNLYLALRQAGLLTEQGCIIPALLSRQVRAFLDDQRPSDIRFFPTSGDTR